MAHLSQEKEAFQESGGHRSPWWKEARAEGETVAFVGESR